MSHEYIDYTSSRNSGKRLHLRRSFYSLDTLPTASADGVGCGADPTADRTLADVGAQPSNEGSPERGRGQTHHDRRGARHHHHQCDHRNRRRSNGCTVLETSRDDRASLSSFASSRLANSSPGSSERAPALSVGGNNNDPSSSSSSAFAGRDSARTVPAAVGAATQFATSVAPSEPTKRRQLADVPDEAKRESSPRTKLALDSNNNIEMPPTSGGALGSTGTPPMQSRKLSPYTRELKLERRRLLERQNQHYQLADSGGRCNAQSKASAAAADDGRRVLHYPTAASRSCCNGARATRRHSDYDTNFLISQPAANDVGSATTRATTKVAATLGAGNNCMAMMSSTLARPPMMSSTDQFGASFNANYM